jgi:hypothetical protein
MGRGFYIFYNVYIHYKEGDQILLKEHILEETKERCDWWDCTRDKEEEELIDFYERQELERREQIEYEMRDYTRVNLYVDGKWRCQDAAQERYTNIVKKYDIKESALISVWKEGDYMIRN